MIEVRNLIKRYGAKFAVNDASFTVQKGVVTGFLGRNGAGKSTTLNIITGYISPSSGSIQFDGMDILDHPREIKRRIGYLPEHPPLYMDMTVNEYLRFACKLKEVSPSRIRSHIDDLVDMAQLGEYRKRLIRNLSKGTKQRVGLAQALAGDPDVIILDEPTVGLDPRQIMEFRGLIRDLGTRHTVLLSSHILSEVADICQRIVIINEGKIVAEDTIESLTGRDGDTARLIVRTVGSKDALEALLSHQPNVLRTEYQGEEEAGTLDFLLYHEPGRDIRSQISSLLVENGYPLLMLKPAETGLEEVFLRVTSNTEGGEKVC